MNLFSIDLIQGNGGFHLAHMLQNLYSFSVGGGKFFWVGVGLIEGFVGDEVQQAFASPPDQS